MKYYPKNGILFTILFIVFITLTFVFVSVTGAKGASNILADIFFSCLVAAIALIAPFLSFLKSIVILEDNTFVFSNLFSNKNYSHNDIQKILIGKRLGTKYSMYIFLNDNKRMWVSSTFWSNKTFEELKNYFSKNNPEKVENQFLPKNN